MSNMQLYIAIGLPCFTIVTALIINLVSISGIRDDIREIRQDLKHIVASGNDLDKRLTVLEPRTN